MIPEPHKATNAAIWLLKEKYGGVRSAEFEHDLTRLENGEPLAYIIGNVPFLGTTIHLGSRPLIPRPETEHWTLVCIKRLKAEGVERFRALDLCAGSGCIGIALLSEFPGAYVDFAEINTAHHETIRKNAVANGIDLPRIHIVGGDLFADTAGPYDLIVSNPPYIDVDHDRTDDAVREYEPHEALYGGAGGTEIIARIIDGAPDRLTAAGSLCIEHEPEQTLSIHNAAEAAGLAARTEKDQYGAERFTVFARKAG